jgi:hypothetical protein
MAVFCDSFVFDALFVVFVLFSTLYIYCTRNFNFWLKNGIPFVKPQPFVGSLKDVVLQKVGIGRYITELYREHKSKPYLGLFAFDRPVLVVFDLDLIKKILVKDSQVFINRNLTVDEEKDPLSYKNIFGLKGQKWRHMRTNLTPTFTSGKMKKMLYLVDKCAKELQHYLDEQTAEGEYNRTYCVKVNTANIYHGPGAWLGRGGGCCRPEWQNQKGGKNKCYIFFQ